jgi:DNA-binding IclR family transcriptional regulator
VSRLTHTLTRMGQLVYLPRDQKYRIGPSAVAMSTSMMRGLQLRNLIRLRLQEVAEQLPGTVGFVIPDRFHLVYLEVGRAANALGLNSTAGSRIAMASTAAGHAYAAALDDDVGDALLAEMERENPDAAKLLRPGLAHNRRFLREQGYVVACGLWSPHINGLAVPLWSPQYQTFVVVTIGLLSAMYDEKRLHKDVAPPILKLSAAIGALLEGADGELFNDRAQAKPVAVPTHKNKIKTEDTNDLEAGTRRPRPARSVRAGDGRR